VTWTFLSGLSNVVIAAVSFAGPVFIYRQLLALTQQEKIQNQELKLTHYGEYTKRYQDILINLPSNIGTSDFKLSSLAKPQKEKTLVYMRAYFDLCYEEWDLHNRGLIDQNDWEVWKDGMTKSLIRPAFRESWKYFTNKNSEFGDKFTKFVKDIHATDDKD
jgi:hypothetical protein